MHEPVHPGNSIRLLRAACIGILHPQRAAREWVAADWRAVGIAYASVSLLFAAYTWLTVLFFAALTAWLDRLFDGKFTLANGWRMIDRDTGGPFTAWLAVGLCFVPLGLHANLALLYWQRAATDARPSHAYLRVLRAFMASVVLLMLVVVAVAALLVLLWVDFFLGNVVLPRNAHASIVGATVVTVLSAGSIAVYALHRFVDAAALPSSNLSLRCERCGYDLALQPLDGRCPECGESIASAVDPTVRRCNVDWESGSLGAVRRWLLTTLAILLKPRAFYSQLHLKTDLSRADVFATMTLRWIGAGAATWLACMWTLADVRSMGTADACRRAFQSLLAVALVAAIGFGSGALAPALRYSQRLLLAAGALGIWGLAFLCCGTPDIRNNLAEALWLPGGFSLIAPLACWVGHRGVAALASAIAGKVHALRDFRWLEKIVLYESAFLWVFCCTWGVMFSSVMIFRHWLTDLLTRRVARNLFFMDAEPGLTLALTLLLGFVWLLRYRAAVQSVRWSNF